MTDKIETYGLTGLSDLMANLEQPRFRTKQLVQWLYGRGVESYDQMTNLPATLRERLSVEAPLFIPTVVDKQISADQSRKYVLQLHDGAQIETVGIPSHDTNDSGDARRLTVCFSTQVGCPMKCAFCATGTEGFTRNLLPGEMVQQILCVQRDMDMRVSNIVAMGQGEPFLNYRNVLDALLIMNDPDALDIGARHITVSTCGILDGIKRFGEDSRQFTLAISLHAARQSVRDAIMPQCASTPLASLKQAVREYYAVCGRRVSLEYLMIRNVNDAKEDLAALQQFCNGLHVHVNLLPMNAVEGSPYQPSAKKTMTLWAQRLQQGGIEATIRHSRGSDIAGACGQLKNKKRSR